MYKMNMGSEGNVLKWIKLNGCIKRYFSKNMRKEVKIRTHNVIVKPALQCCNETWVLEEEDKRKREASEMRFLRPPLGISLGDKIGSTDIKNN
jgi:hypothetical protein